MAAIVGALMMTFAFTGTGTGDGTPPPARSLQAQANGSSPPAAPLARVAAPALTRSEPVGMRIDAIDVRSPTVVRLALDPDGTLQAPRDYSAVGWYEEGPAPGQVGPAVIAGHVDSDTGPAVFYRLGELRPGDTVSVERADDTTATFTVYTVRQYPKDHFPTRRVYGPTQGRAELRLITCGGRFDEATQLYGSNTVAYARLTSGFG